jgi:hypothetical protein
MKPHHLACDITKFGNLRLFLEELCPICRLWLYWAGGQLKQWMTAAVDISMSRDGAESDIGERYPQLLKGARVEIH